MKIFLIFGVVLALSCGQSSCQRYSGPVFKRPQPAPSLSRKFRESGSEPLWLYQGDIPKAPSTAEHPFLPSIIDDVKINPDRRYARSLSTPGHHGGIHTISRGTQSTGPTRPVYHQRYTRDASQEQQGFSLDSQEHLLRGTRSVEQLASQEQQGVSLDSQEHLLRGTRSVEQLASQEQQGFSLDSQEHLLRGTRSVEQLASQEQQGVSLDSQEHLLRGTRSVEQLASQEQQGVSLDSQEHLLRGTRSVEQLASQEQQGVSLDSQEHLLRGTRSVETFDSQETQDRIYGTVDG